MRKGFSRGLSPARKMVLELLHHARKVPSLPLSRVIQIQELVRLRRQAVYSPSWAAIFMKAFALTAEHIPQLRQAYIPFPYPRIYEHPSSECAVLIERTWEGEPVVLGARLRSPDKSSLWKIDEQLRHLREAPVLEVSPFRQILRLGRLPWLCRRFAFWQSLYLSGFKRAKRLGTFMMSSLGRYEVTQVHPLTPLTSYFSYGPIGEDGTVELKIVYDHRVMDGGTVARALVGLEEVLATDIAVELRELAPIGVAEDAAPAEAGVDLQGIKVASR